MEHFNAVANRLIATILREDSEQKRADTIEKWIDIAQECRQLRNFSSLTAILNGLLSGPVYRLKSAWARTKLTHRATCNSLKDIFISCEDRKQARDILEKVSQPSVRLWSGVSLPICGPCDTPRNPFPATRWNSSRPSENQCRFKYSSAVFLYACTYLSPLALICTTSSLLNDRLQCFLRLFWYNDAFDDFFQH